MVVRIIFKLLIAANRVYCRLMFGVHPPASPPLPRSGPVILVSDHSSLADPLVLFATAGRPIRFLMAREFYERPFLRWISKLTGCIPVSRGQSEPAPLRAMLRALAEGDVVGIFPEGGIVAHRNEHGHQGIGYVALKSGAPVVPASIRWEGPRPLSLIGDLTRPARATVNYGAPLVLGPAPGRSREEARAATDRILQAIRELRAYEARA